MACAKCLFASAAIIRPKDRSKLCKRCFLSVFEEEVHQTIAEADMFRGVKRVVVGVSGGKDSTVLAHILTTLNSRHRYGVEVCLLCIDEGIEGYRDKSIEVVKQNERDFGLSLTLLSYSELFGHSMDAVVGRVGRKGNCTYCGVFRRIALEKGANSLRGDIIATGHNADDLAETVLMNYLRGDISRMRRCTMETSETRVRSPGEGQLAGADPLGKEGPEVVFVPRCKPLMYAYEKEIVMYAFYKKLPYFSTECKYSPNAFRGHVRAFIKKLEKLDPSIILNIIRSGKCFEQPASTGGRVKRCTRCGHSCSNAEGVCKGCLLLDTLNAQSK